MRQRVTLTFDNGPTPVTSRVLDVLGARGIRGSFFLVGDRLRRPGARALAERAVAEGHRIGNHSLTHSTPLGVIDDAAEAAREIDEMQALLGDLVPGERFFRPFGGGGVIDRNLFGRRALERLVQGAYTCVLWNSVPRDWEDPTHWPETCLADIAQRAWSVVVLHDLPTGAMDRLPAFLDALDARGVEVAHEFPDDCVPLRLGRPTRAFETLEWLASE